MLPLITEQGIALTHLIVCSFHINVGSVIHLNDYPPDDPHFYTLWNETVVMQEAGVKVMGMIGGAAAGSFNSATLDSTDDATFENYYGQLYDVIRQYNLQGMDLDVEQSMSQSGITRLVTRLNADFGDDFIITMAPVASALDNGGNLSGFDYETLAAAAVTTAGLPMVDFMNAQFYSGFGTMATPADFESIVANGWDPTVIVAGELTNSANGYGYTSPVLLNETVIELVETYGAIGGIMGWEYFNSEPGETAAPWEWAQQMTEILRPDYPVSLTITTETANKLTIAYKQSLVQDSDSGGSSSSSALLEDVALPTVDYFAMVNA
ncbi:hypothetical protein N0V93_004060 [Gnomoniopsis smithogilvyi]|uniref:GH18 domain-containing protein n=1 Tax=Gnomoniopsis smithogilvyi TaxID=1191159 RepID=A0A9W9CZ80_9PEZI|nr:hypothetical protein N0V93_004060 [Gnomoniopsis smithogilvyi]